MVSFAETDSVLKRKLKKYGLDEEAVWHYPSDSKAARAVMFENGQCLIRMRNIPKNPMDIGMLQHEIFHVVTFVMSNIGMDLVIKSTDEAYAYLIGYLTKVIHEKLL
jgi:hypothetical protein